MVMKGMKKKRKNFWTLPVLAVLIGTAAVFFYEKKQQEVQAAQTGQSAIEAGDNQTIQYADIISIVGNEMKISLSEKEEKGQSISTAKEAAYRIPVGTEVETRLGSVTTFSRLASGDSIAMLLDTAGQETIIQKIWIVG